MKDKIEFYQPFKSTRKNKMYDVYIKDENGNPKKISFGDNRYKQNQTPEQRRRYLARATKIKDKNGNLTKDDKSSPNYWSLRYLWDYRG